MRSESNIRKHHVTFTFSLNKIKITKIVRKKKNNSENLKMFNKIVTSEKSHTET